MFRLDVEHSVIVEGGMPGANLHITGLRPGGWVYFCAVDEAGETEVDIVPCDQARYADERGKVVVAVSYLTQGFHPGFWILIMSGEPNDCAEPLTLRWDFIVPAVGTPGEDGRWQLDFDVVMEGNDLL